MDRMNLWRGACAVLALAAGLVAAPAGAQVQYIHTDALGSVVAVTDANRDVIERREFAPYGDQLNAPAADRGPGYTGHVEDGLTGLTYMQQRYYDPAIGRFLSVDPVGPLSDPVGYFGRYHYAANNPYRYTDPDGRAWGLLAKVVKVAAKGGDVAATVAGAVEDGKTIVSSNATVGQRIGAGLSLATEVLSPVSARDVKAGVAAVRGADDVARDVVVSSSRYPETAAHIRDAQAAGHPSVLTIDRAGADANRAAAQAGQPRVQGTQLDEYPPAMFQEGGAGASTRSVSPSDNMGAGACIGNQCRGLPDGARVRIVVDEK